MRKLVAFEAFGIDAVPWSVPDIGVTKTRAGRRVRFARRPKKSDLDRGRASLGDWQRFVADAARAAMASVRMADGPIRLHVEFFARTPRGHRHGSLWHVPLRWAEEKSEFTKTQPRGRPEPDLVNLLKSTEDAVAGVVFANDVQTRSVSSITLYGPFPGVRVTAYEIEPGDFPGHGDPVA